MIQNFVIGRYYFNSLFKDLADNSFIEDLMKEPYIDEASYSYAIGNIHSEPFEDQVLTRGTFGRVKKGTLGDIYDKESQQFVRQELPDLADHMIEFVIHHDTHLIFVGQSSRISPEYFANKFQRIYAHNSKHGGLEIDFLFKEQDVYSEIAGLDRIQKVVFSKLRPSNPSSSDDFEEIEKLIKETGSPKTKMEFNAPERADDEASESEGSLNADSILIKQGIALSAHGYGEAKLTGIKNGKKIEITTERHYRKVEIDFSKDGALEKITQTVEEVAHEAEG